MMYNAFENDKHKKLQPKINGTEDQTGEQIKEKHKITILQ